MILPEQLADIQRQLRQKQGTRVLTVNGGSSTLKCALFEVEHPPRCVLRATVDRLHASGLQLNMTSADAPESISVKLPTTADGGKDVAELFKCLAGEGLGGIGHRLVHGGLQNVEHQTITPRLMEALKQAVPLDRVHLPQEIALIETFGGVFGAIGQVACFDTAFHRDMPKVAQLLAIPRRYERAGFRRFGFHGLSYAYLAQELARVAGSEAAGGRVILAHLGSGASMAAMSGGKPVDTTMGFTPLSGLVMGTRPGDIDAGLITYLMESEKLTPTQMEEFLNGQCGLLGLSETSADMRDLLARRAADPRAEQAVLLFCYQARKFIAGLASTIGGLDTLVFSAGIGMHAPLIRAGICEGMEFLGIHIDAARNAAGAAVISTDASPVTVRTMETDEESVIAGIVGEVLKL